MLARCSKRFFREAKGKTFSVGDAFRKNYFFVDTNVIVGFREKQYGHLNLQQFIQHSGHQFFYTETVLGELQDANVDYPEVDPASNPDGYFKFVDSCIDLQHKEKTVALLDKIWHKEFQGERNATERGFGLTEGQLHKFEKDLYIVFEAGYACYSPGVLPDDDLRAPPLITNNMKLMNKFLLRPRAEHVLEQAINLSGLEHLIPVQLLSDTIDGWERSQERHVDPGYL